MAKIAIVMKEDLSIASKYDEEQPNQAAYGGPWGNASQSIHLLIPAELDAECIKAEEVEGEIQLIEDADLKSAKVQAGRDQKLALLRSLREPKLKSLDVKINELALGLRSDLTELKAYRSALLQLTNDYKYANDDSKGKAALDAYADDLSDFVWPELQQPS